VLRAVPEDLKGADCGGLRGYEQFLAAISDPDHPEHEEMREPAKGEFDPEEFDALGFVLGEDLASFLR
jgi:pRiA4b ORF-3-like protein